MRSVLVQPTAAAAISSVRSGALVLLAVCAGCTSDPEKFGPAACQPPTSSPDPFTVNVAVVTATEGPSSPVAVAGAMVELRKRSDDSVLTSGVSDANGKVALSVATGGKPIDAYLAASGSDPNGGAYVPTYFEDAVGLQPVPAPAAVVLALFPAAVHHDAAQAAGTTWNEADQITDMVFVSCQTGGPILPDATISVVPGDSTHYQSSAKNGFDPTLTATSDGSAIVFNTPPGEFNIDITYQGARIGVPARATAGVYHVYLVHP